MKYFSTFSGIGGFELGIQQAYENMDNWGTTSPSELELHRHKPHPNSSDGDGRRTNPLCVGYSEIDKYAIQIYQSHFPQHQNYGDITKIDTETLPDFDLIVGGFPCQAFSIAGKRGGFDDTRGTLFFEVARIARAKQPRLILLENVKGLLSHDDGRTFRTITATLDELGYDCQWQVLNSKDFGVPQNRERVFIVGHLRGTPRPEVFPLGEGNLGDIESQAEAPSERQRLRGKPASALAARDYKGGGNLIQLNAQEKYLIHNVYGGFGEKEVREFHDISPTIRTPQGGGHIPMVVEKEAHCETCICDESEVVINKNPEEVDAHCETCRCDSEINTPLTKTKIRRLTPLECERLQAYPDGWTEGVSDTQRYKTLGNSVTVNVIREIMFRLL